MKVSGAKKQTLFLTGVNAAVRALGLAMRVWMARTLGAETLGIIELAQSAHMVAIAPLTSGLPAAISRLSAKEAPERKALILETGLWVSRTVSFLLIPLFWLLSPCIARLMGDVRVLPSLWFSAPCILILGYSASYNGYCYGTDRSELPAASELIEQTLRFGFCVLLITLGKNLTTAWLAAVPAAATMAAEMTGLIFVIQRLKVISKIRRPSPNRLRAVYSLALPSTFSRLIQTLLRSITSILIPLQLQKSGLSAAEATASYGMLNGMAMPIMLLPGVFTSALAMVTLPRIAKAEERPGELKRLLRKSFGTVLPLAITCVIALWIFAPFLANRMYRQAELTQLLKRCSLMMLLFPVNHLLGSALSALGLQKQSLWISTVSAAATLAFTYFLAQSPDLGITGVIHAQYLGQLLSAVLSSHALYRRKQYHPMAADGKSF